MTPLGAAAAAAVWDGGDAEGTESEWDHFSRFGVVFRGLRVRMAVATGVTDVMQMHPVRGGGIIHQPC